MRTLKILIFFLIILNFILIGFLISEHTGKTIYNTEKANITRVIDGDTIETSIGKIRLLGINAPEKNMKGYEEAKSFLLNFKGKEIELIKTKENQDKYGRKLRYVFYQGKNINEHLLLLGLAHLFVYKEDPFLDDLRKAEEKARKKEIGIWKKSKDKCASCIILIRLNKIDPGEYVLLKNSCNFGCNLSQWTIKDEATHFTTLNFSLLAGQEKKIEYKGRIWNDNHDTLFLRDSKGLLVLWYRY